MQPVLPYGCCRARGCPRQVNSARKCMPFLKEGSKQEFSSPAFHKFCIFECLHISVTGQKIDNNSSVNTVC